MNAEIIQNIDYLEYGNFIKNNFSSFYHSVNHILFLKDLLKIKPYFIQIKEKNEIIGLMPFFMKKSKHGIVINSLPFFGSYGGIVNKNDCTKLILNELNNFNLENDILSSVIIPNPLLQNESMYEKHYSYNIKDPRLIQCLELNNKSETELWSSFEQRVRRAVRKSQKLNMFVTNPELTDDVIDEFDVEEIVDERTAAIYELGTEFIQLSPTGQIDPEEQARFAAGLVDLRQRLGLYNEDMSGVTINEQVLYQARIQLPSNVITGEYTAETFAISDGRVIASAIAEVEVRKVGFERLVEVFSQRFALLYGLLAVGLSVSMGWIAGRLFAMV